MWCEMLWYFLCTVTRAAVNSADRGNVDLFSHYDKPSLRQF